jgi:hypothetical protein
MRQKLVFTSLVPALFLLAGLASGQGSYKAVAAGPSTAPGLPSAVQGDVKSHGVQFENGQGAPLCEIWWRKGIPAKSIAANGDVLYPGLAVGEFVGVIRFPKGASDYRGQSIKPGTYTLRYAQIPQDGNHMGVSSYRDFLLLIPAADDTDPSQTMTFDQVVKASRLVAGTGHPAVLMLDPVNQGANTFPAAVQDDQGDWALDVKLDVSRNGQSQQMPFAVVLVGQYQG